MGLGSAFLQTVNAFSVLCAFSTFIIWRHFFKLILDLVQLISKRTRKQKWPQVVGVRLPHHVTRFRSERNINMAEDCRSTHGCWFFMDYNVLRLCLRFLLKKLMSPGDAHWFETVLPQEKLCVSDAWTRANENIASWYGKVKLRTSLSDHDIRDETCS